ncbi:hypothetical protein AC579_5741 [Lecanosticta acicola]|uniref:Peroxin 11C n=1 Tax=Lecanosticta acicola TaxID=111012 RepID=A0AAI8YTR6_9PEZI|nr:hypothetical protein AC579_5741 [Lecanosticta acicola]
MASPTRALMNNLKPFLASTTHRTDIILSHTSRLLSTTSGVNSLLTTLFFTLTFLHAQLTRLLSARYESLALSIASRASETLLPGETLIATIQPPHLTLASWCAAVKAAGDTVEDGWILMRLFGLFGVYSGARKVYVEGKRDPVIKSLVWAKILARAGFQVLENGAFLVRRGVLRGEKWTARERGLWVWSGRLWLADTVLELLRLARVRQLKYNEDFGAEEVDEDEKDKKDFSIQSRALEKRWWRSLYINLGWLPPTFHLSFYDEERSPVSEGWVGFSGMVPGLIALQDAWRETA